MASSSPDLGRQQRDWDDLAEVDPRWAIAGGGSATKYGHWDEAAFRSSGERIVDSLLDTARRLGRPEHHGRALDFGCGVGRLTRPLAGRFEACVGLDISERMVDEARTLNADVGNLSFVVSPDSNLHRFEDESFDLIVAKSVLVHMPSRAVVRAYVEEFVRTLRPGGLAIVQVPHHIAPRHRVQHHRRIWALLRRFGVPADVLYRRLRLQPVRLTFVPRAEIEALLGAAGATLLEAEDNHKQPVASTTYFVTR